MQNNIIRFIYISTLTTLYFHLHAQVNVSWSNYPGGETVTTDQHNHIYTATWDYNPAGDITLTKRSCSGSILWNAAYNNTDNTRHEVVTWIDTDNEGNCLVSGTIRSGYSNPVDAASLLMKFDTIGNLLWRNVFESSFEGSYTKKIVIDEENNIYVLGLGSGPNGNVTRVKKFNTTGSAVWTFYDTQGIGAPLNIKLAPDNSLLVTARGTSGSINGYLKLSLDGNLIWSKPGYTSATMGDAAGDSLGNTYIVNRVNGASNAGSILQKFNQAGTLLWAQTNSMSATKVEAGSDNQPVISGFPTSTTGGAAFMKYDTSGTLMWQNLDADGPLILLNHGMLRLDGANNAYLSAGNLFNMAVCKVNADGTNGWVGLVSGSNSAKSFTIFSNSSVYVVGNTTAKLLQDSIHLSNIIFTQDNIIEAADYIELTNCTVTNGAKLILIAPEINLSGTCTINQGSNVITKTIGCN